MRELDLKEVYLDRQGHALKGRVFFYGRGTTATEPIYNVDGTERSNPVYTSNGRLEPQVFLGDRDYTIVWQQYIGNTDMSNDNVEEHWRQVNSAVSIRPTMDVDIVSRSLVTAYNVENLRTVNPNEIVNGLVTLLGFAYAGDKPTVNYRWDANSTESDNGTTCIKSQYSDIGRFKIIVSDEMDARHFGVFPAETWDSVTDELALAVSAAHAFAIANNICIKFSRAGYYPLQSGIYSRFFSENAGAQFVSRTRQNVNFNQYGDKPIYFAYKSGDFDGSITVYGTALKLSFAKNHPYIKWNAVDRFTIDESVQTNAPDEFDGIHVHPYFKVAASKRYTLWNTDTIDGEPLPAEFNHVFRHCRISDRMFTGAIEWGRFTFVDCIINASDFESVLEFVHCQQSRGVTDYDFSGISAGSLKFYSSAELKIRNVVLNGLVTRSNKVSLENVTVNAFSPTNLQYLTAKDCTIASAIDCNTVELEDCSVSYVGSATAKNLTLSARGCYISGAIHSYSANLYRCTVMGDVVTYPQGANAFFTIDGCTMNGHHIVDCSGSTAVNVAGVWKNSHWNATSPIGLQGTNIQDKNVYTYVGNTGTALPGLGSHDVSAEFTFSQSRFHSKWTMTRATGEFGSIQDAEKKYLGYNDSLSATASVNLFFIGRRRKVVMQADYDYELLRRLENNEGEVVVNLVANVNHRLLANVFVTGYGEKTVTCTVDGTFREYFALEYSTDKGSKDTLEEGPQNIVTRCTISI